MPAPDATTIDSVTLPRPPVPPPRTPFPLLAVLAPLAGAAVLFAITRSPLMIAFAALSPVIAIASAIDGRVAAHRRRRSQQHDHEAARQRFRSDVAAAHERERALLNSQHPGAHALMTEPDRRARRWAASSEHVAAVRLGTGSVPSSLAIAGTADSDDDRALLAACRSVDGAPILIDPTGGIGIVAAPIAGRALVRGLVAQLADAHPPGVLAITAPAGDVYDWLDDYPHAALAGDEPLRLRITDDHADATERADAIVSRVPEATVGGRTQGSRSPFGPRTETVVLALAADVDGLPAGCRDVLEVDTAGRITLLTASSGSDRVQGELITARSAARFGDELAAAARSRGVTSAPTLPQSVALADLAHRPTASASAGADSAGLPAVIGVTAGGALMLDLIASGPHAIVTGTTGSGKSELLISWVLAMASRSGPERVNFLLVDFKGGTAFARLTRLPHTVGVVTDLAHGEADRALKSLRAELRRREAALADLGVADVRDSAAAPPRLVIVVDEAAAMLSTFPDLAGLFSDIAARGRALGVHLILGTQRATGVFSDALLANCALRLSLRLASESDSTALLGTDAAARLPHAVPGRLVVLRDGEIVAAQVATSDGDDVAEIAARHSAAAPPSAPWLPALPERLPLSSFGPVRPGSVVLGALDDPDRQAQEGIVYRPEAAHLLVLGVRGSGKSGVLSCIAEQWHDDLLSVPADVEGAWDVLERAESRLYSSAGGACLLLIDDLDALLARFGDEHRDEATDRVRSLLVDGPMAGIAVVCTAEVLPSGLRSVAARFGERLILRQSDRQEHLLAGAPADLYDASAPPGRGVWHGMLAQVAAVGRGGTVSNAGAGRDATSGTVDTLAVMPGRVTVVVSRSPVATAKRLQTSEPALTVVDVADVHDDAFGAQPRPAAATGLTVCAVNDPTVVVGDPDAWQSRWQLLGRLRRESPIVFDGCTLAQVRSLLHSRVLPPATISGHALVFEPDGSFRRVALPA